MKRFTRALLLGLFLAVATRAPLHAEDPEAPDEQKDAEAEADANPYRLSPDEREAMEKFQDLERFAIEALQKRDLEGSTRRYKKLVRRLEADETLREGAKRQLLETAYYNLACSHALADEKDEALAAFEKALEAGFRGWKHIQGDTDLDGIRGDPAFRKAIEDAKERDRSEVEKEEARLAKQLDRKKSPLPGYDFSVETMSGGSLSLESLAGRVVVVAFFAPYQLGDGGDAPEVPLVARLHKKYRKKGVTVVGMTPRIPGTENRTDWVQPYLDEQDVKFDVAIVRPGSKALAPFYDSWHATRIVLIDAKGKVRATCGRIESYEALADAVDRLIELTPPSKLDPDTEKPADEKDAPAARPKAGPPPAPDPVRPPGK